MYKSVYLINNRHLRAVQENADRIINISRKRLKKRKDIAVMGKKEQTTLKCHPAT